MHVVISNVLSASLMRDDSMSSQLTMADTVIRDLRRQVKEIGVEVSDG